MITRLFYAAFIGLLCTASSLLHKAEVWDDRILSHEVDLKNQELKLYWKAKDGKPFGNFRRLQDELNLEDKELVFAMNGGMYLKDQSPQGLYIENGVELKAIDKKAEGYGNFYLQPNGIFSITHDGTASVKTTSAFRTDDSIRYATQSGPMLLIDGEKHPAFQDGSKNLHIRNGVGVLPNGNLLFAMSKERINFFDFAAFFESKGCKNALYLDGFVSRTYLPSKDWKQQEGHFGVIIAESR